MVETLVAELMRALLQLVRKKLEETLPFSRLDLRTASSLDGDGRERCGQIGVSRDSMAREPLPNEGTGGRKLATDGFHRLIALRQVEE